MTDFTPGFYPNVPEQDYLSGAFGPPDGSLSASGIKTLLKSPKQFQHEQAHPWDGSDATRLGTVVHELLLGAGPGFVVLPPTSRKKADQDAKREALEQATAEGKAYITEENWVHAKAAAEAVLKDPEAHALLTAPGDNEISGYAIDADTGIWRRCRFDKLRDDNLAIDIKTARSAAPWSFAKACYDLGYYLSAAYYSQIAADLGRELTDYRFLVVEPHPPYHVAVYRLDDEALALGRQQFREGLNRYAECLASDEWPGYDVPVGNVLCLPSYAYAELDLVI